LNSEANAAGTVTLLFENFTDGNMPPLNETGVPWGLHQTNIDQTWFIDPSKPYSKPYCATVHRGTSANPQDEWLITPSLNFSQYSKINLTFKWCSDFYVTLWKNYVEFNISVSVNGGAWLNIWRFDNMTTYFETWKWIDTILPGNKHIDLSAYSGPGFNDVKIAFQYSSYSTTNASEQIFKIDDIRVTAAGNGSKALIPHTGGPYNWYWHTQWQYTPKGVRFHANLENGTIFTSTTWDFGDGTVITYFPYNLNPIHFYNDSTTYQVTLSVSDNSTTPNRYGEDHTNVTLYLLPPSNITITVPRLSIIKIKADLTNEAEKYNASAINVIWMINISWGLLQKRGKTIANGTIDVIEPLSSATIQSQKYFFGFGLIHVLITATPENFPGNVEHFYGFKIGPLIFLNLKEKT